MRGFAHWRRRRPRYRAIPGAYAQFGLLFRRAGVKWVRNWGLKIVDLLLFVAAALVVGERLSSWACMFLDGKANMSRTTMSG